MKDKPRSFVVAFVAALVFLSVGCHCEQEPRVGDDAEKMESVGPESIFTTSRQKGLNDADVGGETREKALEELFFSRHGASHVFLVRAKDISGAIKETRDVFLARQSPDVLYLSKGRNTERLWLVAFFGYACSDPTWWKVESVERGKTKIRLNYASVDPTQEIARSADSRPYFVWVCLGDTKTGTYSLELFDVRERQATLMRRVSVESPRSKER